jgi:site-specific DNA recombinase
MPNHIREDDFVPFAAGIIVRVSGQRQAEEGLSLERQESICREVAAKYGVPVAGVYIDPGVSGDLFLREGLQSALTDLRAGKFNLLIAYDLSRVTWSPEHRPRIFREIHQAGGRLHVHLMGDIIRPEDYQQEFFAGMQTQADQFYRQHIRAISIGGHRQAASEGRQPVRHLAPFGFHIVTKNDVIRGDYPAEQDGKYILIESEAATVRQIFQWYVHERISLMEILKRLIEQKTPTKHGGQWCRASLYKILKSRLYIGFATYGKLKRYKDETRKGQISVHTGRAYTTIYSYKPAAEVQQIHIPVPRVIEESTWNQAQDILVSNKIRLSGRSDRKYMLTGIIRCPKCNKPMHCSSTGRCRYYGCRHSRPSLSPGGVICSPHFYGVELCHRLTAQALQAFVTRADVMQEAIGAFRLQALKSKQPAPMQDIERERLESELSSIERRRSELLAMSDIDAEFRSGALKELSALWRERKNKISECQRRGEHRPEPQRYEGEPEREYVKQVTDALVNAEAILMDERVNDNTKWKIIRGLVDHVLPHYVERPKGSKHPRVDAVEVTFLPVFEGYESTVALVRRL